MTAIAALVSRAAAWYGNETAVSDARLRLSFRDVDERSDRLAHGLRELSPAPGGRVAVLMQNQAECVEIDFAIAKAGKIRVPVNSRLSDDERRFVVADSGADICIAGADLVEAAQQTRSEVDTCSHVVAVGARVADAHHYESFLAAGARGTPAIAHDPDAGSFILYTSGTTGRPKGALTTNRGRLAATTAMLTDELDVPRGGAIAHVASMAHGSGSKVLAYFLRGARNIPVPHWDPAAFIELVRTERVTGTFVVPTMIASLVEVAGGRRADLASLRTVSYGGAPIHPDRLGEAVALFGDVFVQVYGSCEALHPVLVLRREDHVSAPGRQARLASAGRETLVCEVELRDDSGAVTVPGEPGEMWVRGGNVMAGYWGNPAATDEVLQDGWYRTGDIAWRDEDGYHYIVDRSRDVIITGGLNVYPAEVERALGDHPSVAEVAVIGVPDAHWGESVTALVVPRPGASPSADELIAYAARELASYKKPRTVEFVASLPHGSTGKVLRRELREARWRETSRHV